jgi:hypothetical protein
LDWLLSSSKIYFQIYLLAMKLTKEWKWNEVLTYSPWIALVVMRFSRIALCLVIKCQEIFPWLVSNGAKNMFVRDRENLFLGDSTKNRMWSLPFQHHFSVVLSRSRCMVTRFVQQEIWKT